MEIRDPALHNLDPVGTNVWTEYVLDSTTLETQLFNIFFFLEDQTSLLKMILLSSNTNIKTPWPFVAELLGQKKRQPAKIRITVYAVYVKSHDEQSNYL